MKFQQRIIKLLKETQKEAAFAMIDNLPIGKNIEIVARESVKARKLDQNALMWVGPLKDIEEQAWLNNRQFSAEIWHQYFKEQFLPDEMIESYIHEVVTKPEIYKKWGIDPKNERIIVSSTKDLTVHGFSQYLEQIYAFGANLGVLFHINDKNYE